MEIAILAEKLAEIRQKYTSLVDEINEATRGKPFYGRITLANGRHLTGLIEKLRVNEYKLVFKFTVEKLVDGKPVERVKEVKLSFEKFRGITPFETKDKEKISLRIR